MFKQINNKPKNFRLYFICVFIGTVIFQMMINNLSFAAESNKEQKQFLVEVSGKGKPVILIPGLMSDDRVWQNLEEQLGDEYQFHKINIAGFAKTPAVDTPSLLAVKNQLISYISDQKLHQPAIIGHSLGGFMAFWLSTSLPEEIGPMISVDGLPFIGPVFTQSNTSTVESLAGQAQQIKSYYYNMTPQQLAEQSRYGLSIQATTKESKAKVMSMIETSDPKTVGNAIYTLLSQDLRQDIRLISSPVLLLGASGGFNTEKQRLVAQSLYKEQLAALPSAQLKMNTSSRHFIMYDDPKWLTQQVSQFLQAHL